MELQATIRAGMRGADGVVFVGNTIAFFLFLGNCWWDSVAIAYGGALLPLALQCAWLGTGDKTLRESLLFGAVIGIGWPIGEYAVVHSLGWWGAYLAPGPKVLETPLYCLLVGALASSYCYYVAARTREIGYGEGAAIVVSGTSALLLGVLGENFFVMAGMWTYDTSSLDIGYVPAFVPIGYAFAYSAIPPLQRAPLIVSAIGLLFATLISTVGLGLVTGFFPR